MPRVRVDAENSYTTSSLEHGARVPSSSSGACLYSSILRSLISELGSYFVWGKGSLLPSRFYEVFRNTCRGHRVCASVDKRAREPVRAEKTQNQLYSRKTAPYDKLSILILSHFLFGGSRVQHAERVHCKSRGQMQVEIQRVLTPSLCLFPVSLWCF